MSKPKISRSALKAVIKECLVEILAEGIGPEKTSNQLKKSRSSTVSRKKPVKNQARNLSERREVQNDSFDSAVKRTASSLTSDPVMAAIFEETARTTLQEQRENTPPVVADNRSPLQDSNSGSELAEMFEGSSNWATLAFAEKKTV